MFLPFKEDNEFQLLSHLKEAILPSVHLSDRSRMSWIVIGPVGGSNNSLSCDSYTTACLRWNRLSRIVELIQPSRRWVCSLFTGNCSIQQLLHSAERQIQPLGSSKLPGIFLPDSKRNRWTVYLTQWIISFSPMFSSGLSKWVLESREWNSWVDVDWRLTAKIHFWIHNIPLV